MVKWKVVFRELSQALEEAKKNHRYKDTTNLVIKVLLSSGKGFKYKTKLSDTSKSLWHLTEKHGNIVKILVESVRGKGIYFHEIYRPERGEGSTGDEQTIPSFKELGDEDKSLKLRLITCQIQDGLREEDE